MGVEVVESEVALVSVEAGREEDSLLMHGEENGQINQVKGIKEPIKFGSHVADEPSKVEAKNVTDASFPKDAVDEWPAPQQIHSIYFVKYRSYEDQSLKSKLDQADKELQRKNQARSQIIEKLRAIRADRGQVIEQLKSLGGENKQFRMIMDEKRKEMEPLQQALGKLRGPSYANKEKGYGLCSSEGELNELIKSLQYRIQHESIPLTEEKQILREIKQLEGTREKVIANAALRAKIQDAMGEKEAIQDQVKVIGVDLDGVKKEQQVVRVKVKQLEEEKEAIDKEISSLQDELTSITTKRDKAFETIQELRKQREEQNACFYQNRSLLIKAKDLASKKDVKALKELSDLEVERFLSLWSSSKACRDDYQRRILPSLDIRQLSKDGRMRNPDEKPLVVPVAPAPTETAALVAKTNVKQVKEDPPSHPKHATASINKVPREKSSNLHAEDKITEGTLETSGVEDGEEVSGLGKLKKDPPKENGIDEAKLKELKREEEMAKAKLALERKKKLAEKAAAKAAVKAQKEAEKKLKEREKKAKKKAGVSASPAAAASSEPDESTEATEEVSEPEKVETVEALVPPRKNDRKENSTRYRKRSKGTDSLPKMILKRKKSPNYWVWAAAAAAAVAVLLLVAIGYKYLL